MFRAYDGGFKWVRLEGSLPMATQEPAGPGMVGPGPGGCLNPEADSFGPSQFLLV